jgi:hypothetical protein
MMLSLGVAIVAIVLWSRTRRILAVTAVSFGLFWVVYGFIGQPILNPSSSASAIMVRARAEAGPITEIGLVAWKEQNLLQARGPVTDFGYRQPVNVQLARAIAWLKQSPDNRVLMVNQVNGLECINYGGPGTTHLDKANRRSWWLVKSEALLLCNEALLDAPR